MSASREAPEQNLANRVCMCDKHDSSRTCQGKTGPFLQALRCGKPAQAGAGRCRSSWWAYCGELNQGPVPRAMPPSTDYVRLWEACIPSPSWHPYQLGTP